MVRSGDACDNWKGKVVVVFPTEDDLRGRMVPVLRVRIPPPKQAAAGNGQTIVDEGIQEFLQRTPVKAKQPDPVEVDPKLNDDPNF